jgi:small neutral amino acid transporter SnatA (MarC family)
MIKVLHTVIWAFFVLIIFYILYSALVDRIDILTWMAMALIIVEGIILLMNGWRCPFTNLGEKYTKQTEVGFDIFLPRWLAKNNKTIFTSIYLLGVIMVIYRVLT